MPRSLMALKDRYGRVKDDEEISSDEQEENNGGNPMYKNKKLGNGEQNTHVYDKRAGFKINRCERSPDCQFHGKSPVTRSARTHGHKMTARTQEHETPENIIQDDKSCEMVQLNKKPTTQPCITKKQTDKKYLSDIPSDTRRKESETSDNIKQDNHSPGMIQLNNKPTTQSCIAKNQTDNKYLSDNLSDTRRKESETVTCSDERGHTKTTNTPARASEQSDTPSEAKLHGERKSKNENASDKLEQDNATESTTSAHDRKETYPWNKNERAEQQIELEIWPKLIQNKREPQNREKQYWQNSFNKAPHHKWGNTQLDSKNPTEKHCSLRQIKTALPLNGLISEFGHLGFRDHWVKLMNTKGKTLKSKQDFMNTRESEQNLMNTREIDLKMQHENNMSRNWGFNKSYLCGFYGQYQKDLHRTLPGYCWTYPNIEAHEYYRCAAAQGLGPYGMPVTLAAERLRQQLHSADKFRQQMQRQSGETATTSKKRAHGDECQIKKHELFWPEIYQSEHESRPIKAPRSTTTSPEISTEQREDKQDRPHNCTVCDKTFKRRSSLATHKFIHTNLKPHVCNVCSKRFLRKSDLKKHGLMHSGRKPYQCEKCGRRFSQSSNMLTHLRRHMGIRPFDCGICGRSFFRKVDLKRHEGRHLAKKQKARCEQM